MNIRINSQDLKKTEHNRQKFTKRVKQVSKNCCFCPVEILIKYNLGTGEYIKKNDWYYWTEKEENKDKYICNSCLLNTYYNFPKDYLKAVKNKKKRRIFSTYVYNGTIE